MSQERVALQKLLTADQGARIVSDGQDEVVGIVTDARAAASLSTPARLLAAYGYEAEAEEHPRSVDVVRFFQPTLARLSTPSSRDSRRPWPTYPSGFLRGDSLVPVWQMSRTRFPVGAEYWRIRDDGEQRMLSVYEGAARGWRGATAWRPPSRYVGTRARWQGSEYVADVQGEDVLLTVGSAEQPDGFSSARPNVWMRTVPLRECEVFETVLTSAVDGVGVRVLETDAHNARVELVGDDPVQAERLGAAMVDPGVFEAVLPHSRLGTVHGVENGLAVAGDQG